MPAFLTSLNPSGDPNQALPRDVSANLYVATPELLRYYGLGPAAIGPGTEVLTPHRADDLSFFLAAETRPGRQRRRCAVRPTSHCPMGSSPPRLSGGTA